LAKDDEADDVEKPRDHLDVLPDQGYDLHDPEVENVMLEAIIFVMLLPSTEAALSREVADYLVGEYFAEEAIFNVVRMLTVKGVKQSRRWARSRMLEIPDDGIYLEDVEPIELKSRKIVLRQKLALSRNRKRGSARQTSGVRRELISAVWVYPSQK